MAALIVTDTALRLELSRWEKLGALRSGVEVRHDQIASVAFHDKVRLQVRGLRAPGTGLPGVIALGTWRGRGTKDVVAVSGNEPGYVIELRNHQIDRLIVSSERLPALEALG